MVVTDSGHGIHEEQPELFDRELLQFLKRATAYERPESPAQVHGADIPPAAPPPAAGVTTPAELLAERLYAFELQERKNSQGWIKFWANFTHL